MNFNAHIMGPYLRLPGYIEKRGISNAEVVDCPRNYVGHSDLDFLHDCIHFDGVKVFHENIRCSRIGMSPYTGLSA